MKCVENISNSKVFRTTDKHANHLVAEEGGWRYVSKSKWKQQGRAVMGRGKQKQFQVPKPKVESDSYNRDDLLTDPVDNATNI